MPADNSPEHSPQQAHRSQPRCARKRLVRPDSTCNLADVPSLFPRLSVFVALALPLCAQQTYKPESVQVYFSPDGGATDAVVREITAAKKSIHVQAYSFTSPPIAKALVEAKKRGLQVFAILDKSQKTEKYTEADFLAHGGVPTFFDEKHAIAHNKIIVIDDATVITGSFNFTRAAEERNTENLLVIRDPKLAARYLKNWQDHKAHAEPYRGR